jgi:hypothetical protein
MTKRKIWIGVVVVIVGLVVALGVILWNKNFGTQARMERYLEEKYGQKFVVENVRVQGVGVGIAGSVQGDAYPEGDPSLKFLLRKSRSSDLYDYDSFLSELWSRQQSSKIDYFIKQFGNVKTYRMRVDPSIKFRDSIHGHTPNFAEVQRDHPDQFSCDIGILSLTRHSDQDIPASELKRAFELVRFIREECPQAEVSIRYSYGLEENDNQYVRFEVAGRNDLMSFVNPSDLKHNFRRISGSK